MKRHLAALGLLAAAVSAVTAAPAQAAPAAAPAGALFADCPALPAGADAGTWTCYALTSSDTLLRFNKMSAHTTAPVKLTVAQGKVGGQAVAKVGALRADPIPFVTGIAGTPAEIPHPLGWKVEISPTGTVAPGALVPHELGLTARILGTGLGASCTIGPAKIKTDLQWVLPWVDADGLAWKLKAYDSVYALPAAKNCNGQDLAVDTLIGVPANATSNHFQADWTLHSSTY
ncbi:hypothetical protein [Actinomadura parmotrematis]|uniref:Secreted protein n=1 Tax=Actinomadura parmotrematis TaxID=2864039 RepID=A0ABS7FR49_9ACTN|nr:hypothetical protein [Actinomadura parmotrematis]MBW8482003.1 hypothetical protein [Actinomadura parmotrematis]